MPGMDMHSIQLQKKIAYIDSIEHDPVQLEAFRLSALEDFRRLAKLTKVKFIFKYLNNQYNRARNRAGNLTGTRTGSINLETVPLSKHPRSRNTDTRNIRYYDFNRANWRSFRTSNIVLVTQVWSLEKNRWTTDFSEYEDISADDMTGSRYYEWIARIKALNPDNANN